MKVQLTSTIAVHKWFAKCYWSGFANGEGKTADLVGAYAWSVLAAESGSMDLQNHSDTLLEQNSDKADAEKRATKLMKKYGESWMSCPFASGQTDDDYLFIKEGNKWVQSSLAEAQELRKGSGSFN